MISDLKMEILANNVRERAGWEQARYIAYYIGLFNSSKPKEYFPTMKDFDTFPWEGKSPRLTKHEQLLAARERIRERNKKLNNV